MKIVGRKMHGNTVFFFFFFFFFARGIYFVIVTVMAIIQIEQRTIFGNIFLWFFYGRMGWFHHQGNGTALLLLLLKVLSLSIVVLVDTSG